MSVEKWYVVESGNLVQITENDGAVYMERGPERTEKILCSVEEATTKYPRELMRAMKESDPVIDYAHPCMMAERALKDAHLAVLSHDYDRALQECQNAITESRIMALTLTVMKEKANGIRKQV